MPAEPQGKPIGRRIVLGMIGLGAVGVATGRWISSGVNNVVATAAPQVSGLLPAAGGFRIYTVTSGYPDFDPATYRLQVSGLVDRPMSLSLADIADLRQTSYTKDFQCVTGWRVDDVPWSGVLMSDLLDAAGVQQTGKALQLTSFDGAYTESLTIEQARLPQTLVATTMYGKPIPKENGAPVRLVIPPMYGYKSIKWLSDIEVTSEVIPGYWEQRGYAVDAWVGDSNGRSDAPVV